MLSELEDQPDRRCTETIDFKTAKDINNDLVGILRALSDVTVCTEVGEEIKRRFTEVIIYELEKLESSKILL
jgi:hypothetical protein